MGNTKDVLKYKGGGWDPLGIIENFNIGIGGLGWMDSFLYRDNNK